LRILVLSASIPFPPISGGKLRTYHLMRALSRRHDLTLVGFTYGEQAGAPTIRVRVVPVPWEPPPLYQQMNGSDAAAAQRAADRLNRDGDDPWCVNWADSSAMETAIRRLCEEDFDMVLVEGTPMARFPQVLPDDVPRVLDFFDVYTRMRLRNDGSDAAAFEAERTRRFERGAALQCDLCLAVSEEEAAAVKELLGVEHVRVVPNGVDTARFTPAASDPDPASLLFVGTLSYRPNSEGVGHFAKRILPRIHDEVPEAVLHVVGVDPPHEVTALAGERVAVQGMVPDVLPYYHRAAVVVVPLLSGGGTKIKVLEAAACGKAIVATTVGVDGLPFRDGEDLVVADSDEDFARAVASLLNDGARRGALGTNARLAALDFDWEAIGNRFRQLIESVCDERTAKRSPRSTLRSWSLASGAAGDQRGQTHER
jgi:polysaccharide biosynthesis protein PslH